MTRPMVWALLLLAAVPCRGAWEFSAPLTVSEDATGKTFFHLSASGRKNIALSGDWIAVGWEDDRDGVPRIYAALRHRLESTFRPAVQVSQTQDAYEPAIAGMAGGRFVLVWEEAGTVYARLVSAERREPALRIAGPGAGQASVAAGTGNTLRLVWSEQSGANRRIKLAALNLHPTIGLQKLWQTEVEPGQLVADQTYPSVAMVGHQRTVVAWEDRRAGHTRILAAFSHNRGRSFQQPVQVNRSEWLGQSGGLGRGSGAMRVALADQGAHGVAAVWADKRDFLTGYDVYAAFAQAPEWRFGEDQKVQDAFGNESAQWHPAIAATAKQVAVTWDDDRDGTSDIWLSWSTQGGWSDDLAVPGAAGPGVQSHPSLALDTAGNLHLTWVDKIDLNSPSRLRYVFGRAKDAAKLKARQSLD